MISNKNSLVLIQFGPKILTVEFTGFDHREELLNLVFWLEKQKHQWTKTVLSDTEVSTTGFCVSIPTDKRKNNSCCSSSIQWIKMEQHNLAELWSWKANFETPYYLYHSAKWQARPGQLIRWRTTHAAPVSIRKWSNTSRATFLRSKHQKLHATCNPYCVSLSKDGRQARPGQSLTGQKLAWTPPRFLHSQTIVTLLKNLLHKNNLNHWE